jgi:hypothetical protein
METVESGPQGQELSPKLLKYVAGLYTAKLQCLAFSTCSSAGDVQLQDDGKDEDDGERMDKQTAYCGS